MDLQLLLLPELSPDKPTQRPPAASSVRIVQEEVGGFDADPLDYWREVILRNFADVEVRAADRSDFHGRVSARHSDAGRLSLIVATEQSVQRRYREPRTAYEDVFFVVLMTRARRPWSRTAAPCCSNWATSRCTTRRARIGWHSAESGRRWC